MEEEEHRAGDHKRDQPGAAGQAQHADERGDRGRERDPGARGPSGQECSRREGRDQREQPGAGQFLDPAPERVAVEDRRLRRDERGPGPQGRPEDQALEDRVERQRQHRRQEGEVGLEQPGDVVGKERVADPDRHQAPGRVAEPDRRRERRLVGGGSQAREAAGVLHHAVGHREVGRSVVELDVAVEGRPAREHGWGGEGCEGADRGRERRTPAADRPRRSHDQACSGERDRKRSGEHGRRAGQRGKLAGQDHDRQPGRQQERTRQPLARGDLDEAPAAEREPRQQQREGDPGDEQRDYRTGWI